ncbi:MAG: undecaprenyldiphospho-muramoylpentapeptide beta-N-acetylglucosaminyltransferase [Syntrophomonadaceae bacterium]|nr:undecaprenyldiphospho-muramoylpentapeptide beta-N-acetylglucosaminyltransferase [Syntrophomonadaceae bacterium]MDD3022425.1 undecaprenyldiphospho-muramoylpentapeptide beta-N-acetylglucosaminyltransferase [Syntrophomonadaceae bacterium]
MRVIISGGGTGGHIYPALAIAQGLKQRLPEVEILYVGSDSGMESTIVPREGLDYKSVNVSGIDRSSMLKASQSLVKFPRSFFQAWDIIKSFQPDILVGTGGYASFPVVLAGTFFACKTIIHEQNAVLGLANRNLVKRVNYTLLTFAEAAKDLNAKNVKITGLPVRKEFLLVNSQEARAKMGISPEIFTLLVFGGSRGALSINRAMLNAAERFQDDNIQVIWITGEANYEECKREIENKLKSDRKMRLQILPYLDDMENALAVADLAVCRAGASTLCELAMMGLPAILIPYPYAAENHQEKNARALVEKNSADIIIDEFLDGDTLYKRIEYLRTNKSRLKDMSENIRKEARPNALKDIVDIILS